MLKSNSDQKYAEYEKTKDYKTDPTQFHSSEVYIVDDSDYFKTYNDEYDYHIPSGLVPKEEDYFHDYGQKNQFMLIECLIRLLKNTIFTTISLLLECIASGKNL